MATDNKVPNYVLVTPARDEATFIRQTLEAMVVQTILPLKWIIVSDGSTDGTDEIVKEFTSRHSWIELIRMPERKERHFGGKVAAFNAGLDRVRHLDYGVIGNLDADSTFDPDYIEYLLGKFGENPKLGVAGTNYIEDKWDRSLKHDYRFASIQDVTGQCQLFRRRCFEDIGGYKPSRNGGVDLMATLHARMKGWETHVFTDKLLFHNRQQGTANAHPLLIEFSNGRKDYIFGSGSFWEISRAAYRLTRKPRFLGGILLISGYFWALVTRAPRTASPELIAFRKKEHMNRLRGIVRNLFGRGAGDADAASRAALVPTGSSNS